MEPRTERHPDVFNPAEAAAYLGIPERTLKTLKAKGVLVGHAGWTTHDLYYREDLDKCVRRMFGRDATTEAKGLRMAE